MHGSATGTRRPRRLLPRVSVVGKDANLGRCVARALGPAFAPHRGAATGAAALDAIRADAAP